MQELVESGVIVYWLLAFVVLEVALLSLYWRLTKRGLAPAALLLNVGAGACLMLSLQAALLLQGWQVITGWLLVALFFHVGDLWFRWRCVPKVPHSS